MGIPSSRREFMAAVGGAAAWPIAARGQQANLSIIGYIGNESSGTNSELMRALHDGLRQAGYVEGRNLAIEYRWMNGEYDRLPALAADLVKRRVAVIIAATFPAALAAKAATTSIPIVFSGGSDPVESGLVASLNKPGANITGVTFMAQQLGPKRLEILHEVLPAARSVALLVNPTNSAQAGPTTRDIQAAGSILDLRVNILHASTERDFDALFSALAQLRARGLVIGNDPFLAARASQLGALTLEHAVPSISFGRNFVTAGGLMSYGPSGADVRRLLGIYVGRILNGERPADLPIQQATKVEFIINMKTATALGIRFPVTLLGRADEVIE
jgi:putative ABC transport system substrate-binding protein